MVLGDVVEVVGDRAADVLRLVGDEPVEQRDDGSRVGAQRPQLRRPRQPRTRALGDKPPDVLVWVLGPSPQEPNVTSGWRSTNGRIANSQEKRGVSRARSGSATSGSSIPCVAT